MATPTAGISTGPLEVVVVYAFDSSKAPAAYHLGDLVYWLVQDKIGASASSSRLSYIYTTSANNSYVTQKRFARSRAAILSQARLPCTKNMACGLPEAHRLIGQCEGPKPKGVILLLSDGCINKGDFFDGAEEFVSKWPVHTFTFGGDAYNQGLRAIAANSPGGTFNPVRVPDNPKGSALFSQYLDDILFGNNNISTGNKKGPLNVVIVYAFDCTTVTPNWNRVNQAYWLVQSKLGKFPASCLSYIYPWLASNRYTTEKRTVGDGIKKILPESTTGCTKNMASGLQEAHRLINLSSTNPNGIILLFSDGSPNNKGDFFDKAEEFVSKVPVHTFTLGSDVYNQGLRTIVANSPGGTFNSIPIPEKQQPDPWSPISRLLDSILSDTVNDIPKAPTLYAGNGPLDVVVLYAFDCTTVTPNWDRVNQAYWNVQSKLAKFPGSCLSYIYPWLASNRYTTEKRTVGGGIKHILRESTTGCTKNMASGLQEAHRLIGLSSTNPNGIILLFSDGSPNKGDFFDMAEDFISTVPVHTFILGSDAYNQGLRTIVANSPGGSFNSIPVPNNQDPSSPFSLLLDGILSGTMNDDETTPSSNTGSTKSLVAINQVKYLKDNAALTVDTVTAEVEIKATTCTAVREGLDLVAILDVSSRMATKMDNLKNAMKFVIMKLTPVDRLSIVIFSDGAARLNPLRSMTPDAHKDLIALVNGLKAHAHGGTNIRVGLETGLAVVTGRANTKARTPNIFLVTDGMQTISNAKNVDASQVAIYTFGFGNDSDHNLLSDIALKSHGGLFSAVPDGTNLSVPLSQLLGGLLTVVGQDLQLTLTPNKDEGDDVDTIVVAPGTHYTQTVDPTTGVITISFGTIFAGESRKVIITINLKKSTKKTEYDAALSEAQTIFTAQGKVHNHMAPRDITILRVTNPSQLVPGSSDTSRELQAELARRAEADAIRKARLLADAGNLDGARYTLVNAQNALEDVVLSDGQKLVVNTLLRAELVQLVKLMDSKVIYESKGRAYALASEASHGRQRYACRGGEDDDVRLFSTPRMDSYLEQAKSFEKDPTVTVASADEDVKKEVEANPLAAISGDLALYLRTAIEALQGMRRIIAAKA